MKRNLITYKRDLAKRIELINRVLENIKGSSYSDLYDLIESIMNKIEAQ